MPSTPTHHDDTLTTPLPRLTVRLGSGRIRSLTTLRLLLTAVIVADQLTQYWLTLPDEWRGMLATAGTVAVGGFFVLSGFLLAWSGADHEPTAVYARRRFGRIYPLHAATLLLSVGVIVLLEDKPIGPGALLANLGLVQAWFPQPDIHYGLNSLSWVLSCELAFYLAFPLLSTLVDRWLNRFSFARLVLALVALSILAVVLVVTFVPTAAEAVLHLDPVVRAVDFVVGIALGRMMLRGWRPPVGRFAATVLAVGLLVLLSNASWQFELLGLDERAPGWAGNSLFVLPLMLFVGSFAARELTGVPSVFTHRVPVLLGEWSLALFLVHQLVLRAALVLWPGLPSSGTGTQLLGAALAVLASLVLAALLHHGVELPLRRLIAGRTGREGTTRTPHVVATAPAGPVEVRWEACTCPVCASSPGTPPVALMARSTTVVRPAPHTLETAP
jgi:peptidoglycan/LPS O-acetylase OafA/YrhL